MSTLIQLLPRSDYSFNAETMNQVLKTLAVNKRSIWEKLTKPFEYDFIIDCDSKGLFNFYLACHTDKNIKLLLQTFNSMFGEKGAAFIQEKPLVEHREFQTLYTKEEYNENGQRKKLNEYGLGNTTFEFLMSQMQENLRLTISFYVLKEFLSSEKRFRSSTSEAKLQCLMMISGLNRQSRGKMTHLSNAFVSNVTNEKAIFVRYKKDFMPSLVYANELMSFFQIPTLDRKGNTEFYKKVNKLSVGQATLNKEELASGIKVGQIVHPTLERDVYVLLETLRKHAFIVGQTGSGKSSVAEEMINSMIDEMINHPEKITPGFTFFDPAESAVLGVIDMILKRRDDGKDISKILHRIHYIDLTNEDFVFPISMLSKNMEATEIVDYFKMIFGDENTKQVDRLVSSSINALLKDKNPHTIQDIIRIFADEDYRKELALKLEKNIYANEEVSFLRGKFTATQVDPIYNRLDPLRNSNHKKLMFGMSSDFDKLKNIKKWMDEGHIVLFNLKGLTNFDIKFVVGYIMLNYYNQGLKRVQNALIHPVFIDETHKVQIPVMEKILAELRKYGVAIIPMTQFLEQLDQSFLKALLGNVSTKIILRLGDESARRIIPNLPNAKIDSATITCLPDRQAFLNTEEGEMKTVMIQVAPPYRYTNGKLVNYKDVVALEENASKNRSFAIELMKRDLLTRQEAEEIVFADLLKHTQLLQEEEERLVVGDQF